MVGIGQDRLLKGGEMLIQSNRHTQNDLDLWGSYVELDEANWKALNVERLVDNSINAISVFAEEDKGSGYIGVSWGKDSVVVAALSCMSGIKLPMIWICVEPIKNPDCGIVRDAFLSEHNVEYDEIEVWCKHDERGWHASGTLEKGAAEAVRKHGDRYISGIVKYESGQRLLSRKKHGISTHRCCRPIIDWPTAAVYAFLHHFELPVHPAYAMTGGGRWDRERIRVASLGGRRGDGMGRTEWEREYYPDILNRIEASR